MHPLLAGRFFCLGRGTGVGESGLISVLLNSTSPIVTRLFTINTENKFSHTAWPVWQNDIMLLFSSNTSFPLLFNWNISVTVGISFSPDWELFTFLVTADTHFLFLYSHGGLFLRELLTRSCPGIVEKRLTRWSKNQSPVIFFISL